VTAAEREARCASGTAWHSAVHTTVSAAKHAPIKKRQRPQSVIRTCRNSIESSRETPLITARTLRRRRAKAHRDFLDGIE
jgi:hypothetical protein